VYRFIPSFCSEINHNDVATVYLVQLRVPFQPSQSHKPMHSPIRMNAKNAIP